MGERVRLLIVPLLIVTGLAGLLLLTWEPTPVVKRPAPASTTAKRLAERPTETITPRTVPSGVERQPVAIPQPVYPTIVRVKLDSSDLAECESDFIPLERYIYRNSVGEEVDVGELIEEVSYRHGIDPVLLLAWAGAESRVGQTLRPARDGGFGVIPITLGDFTVYADQLPGAPESCHETMFPMGPQIPQFTDECMIWIKDDPETILEIAALKLFPPNSNELTHAHLARATRMPAQILLRHYERYCTEIAADN